MKPFEVGDVVVRRVGRRRGERAVIKEIDRAYFEPCATVHFPDDDYEQVVALRDIEHEATYKARREQKRTA